MERGGSAQILALEERAHNLTRLPYALGENIQVVRYEVGQKCAAHLGFFTRRSWRACMHGSHTLHLACTRRYGAHRDFFNPNDYHKQPHMLRMTEYGGRNRLATVFWYLQSVAEGGETFFPRALNEEGKEYNPWNGDHEDCYRGMSVPPVRGNAVLFYSIVPDGRLDERAREGGEARPPRRAPPCYRARAPCCRAARLEPPPPPRVGGFGAALLGAGRAGEGSAARRPPPASPASPRAPRSETARRCRSSWRLQAARQSRGEVGSEPVDLEPPRAHLCGGAPAGAKADQACRQARLRRRARELRVLGQVGRVHEERGLHARVLQGVVQPVLTAATGKRASVRSERACLACAATSIRTSTPDYSCATRRVTRV